MTQNDFAAALALRMYIPQIIVKQLIAAWIARLKYHINLGDPVVIAKLCTFYTVVVHTRRHHDINLDTTRVFPAKIKVKAKPLCVAARNLYPAWRPHATGRAFYSYPDSTLAQEICDLTGHDILTCNRFIYSLADQINHVLGTGDYVTFQNFGRFALSVTQDRNGTNPRTQATILIEGRPKMYFVASESLKELVN